MNCVPLYWGGGAMITNLSNSRLDLNRLYHKGYSHNALLMLQNYSQQTTYYVLLFPLQKEHSSVLLLIHRHYALLLPMSCSSHRALSSNQYTVPWVYQPLLEAHYSLILLKHNAYCMVLLPSHDYILHHTLSPTLTFAQGILFCALTTAYEDTLHTLAYSYRCTRHIVRCSFHHMRKHCCTTPQALLVPLLKEQHPKSYSYPCTRNNTLSPALTTTQGTIHEDTIHHTLIPDFTAAQETTP